MAPKTGQNKPFFLSKFWGPNMGELTCQGFQYIAKKYEFQGDCLLGGEYWLLISNWIWEIKDVFRYLSTNSIEIVPSHNLRPIQTTGRYQDKLDSKKVLGDDDDEEDTTKGILISELVI